MPMWDVQLKTTTYTDYTVEAEDAATARRLVENKALRAMLPSRESSRGDGEPIWVATYKKEDKAC